MSEKRRAEIEAKRAKLAELRKARADRQKAEAAALKEARDKGNISSASITC